MKPLSLAILIMRYVVWGILSVTRFLFGAVTPTKYVCSFDSNFTGAQREVWAFSPAKAAIKAAEATGVKQGQAIYVKSRAAEKTYAFICHTGLFGLVLRGVERVSFGQ